MGQHTESIPDVYGKSKFEDFSEDFSFYEECLKTCAWHKFFKTGLGNG